MKDIWTIFDVRFDFLTSLCASVPANRDLIDIWLRSRAPKAIPPGGRSISEIQEEVFSTLAEGEPTLEQQAQEILLVFQRRDGSLVLRASTFRSHIKDCARTISSQLIGKLPQKGERSFSTRVLNGLYHDESVYWVPILDSEGEPFTEPTGIRPKAVHARGPRGEAINALKHFEFVDGARVNLRLKVLGKSVSQDDIETVLTYGSTHGYGGERSDGEGRYTFEIRLVELGTMPEKYAAKAEPVQAR